jgi:hypothetical protein
MQNHHLVEVRYALGRNCSDFSGREYLRASAQIDDDDLVTEAVHFDEREGLSRSHAALYGENRAN